MICRDPGPEYFAKREKKLAERMERYERKLIARFMRKLGLEPRCEICGASSQQARSERCKGACEL